MAFQVVISEKAEADVAAALKWFRDQQATEAGGRWFRMLMEKVSTLENRPDRCSLAAESQDLAMEIRELLFGRRQHKYRILFQISGKFVQIVRVWHGSRNSITSEEI